MSILSYYKGVRLVILVLLIGTAWATTQGYLPRGAGWIITLLNAIFLVMINIIIKEHEDDL